MSSQLLEDLVSSPLWAWHEGMRIVPRAALNRGLDARTAQMYQRRILSDFHLDEDYSAFVPIPADSGTIGGMFRILVEAGAAFEWVAASNPDPSQRLGPDSGGELFVHAPDGSSRGFPGSLPLGLVHAILWLGGRADGQ